MAQRDPVISKHFPFVSDYLPAVRSSDDLPNDLAEIRRHAAVVLGQLKDYHAYAVRDLRQLLSHGDVKEKSAVYRLSMAVAVNWSITGYSREYLSEVDDLLDSSEGDFSKRFDKFVNQRDTRPRNYSCLVGLTWPAAVPIREVRAPYIALTQGLPNRRISELERHVYGNPNPNDVFAEVRVEALDAISACRIAEERLSNLLAVLNLYLVQRRLELKGRYALVSDGSSPVLVRIERSQEISLRDIEDAPDYVNRFLDLMGRPGVDPEDADQLASALQYHRLALSAATDESRLVNLWIALECLARRGQGSIIETICRYIAPSTAIGNIHKLLANLSGYISRLLYAANRTLPLEVFQDSKSQQLSTSDLLDALLDVKDGPKIEALYKVVSSHELIRYRVFLLRTRTFANGPHAAASMTTHLQNIEWQLRRIYRARNQITHRGRGSASLPHLPLQRYVCR